MIGGRSKCCTVAVMGKGEAVDGGGAVAMCVTAGVTWIVADDFPPHLTLFFYACFRGVAGVNGVPGASRD